YSSIQSAHHLHLHSFPTRRSSDLICYLNARMPSKTLTTLPDDLLHYKEPRILTVRESARIQSFPDDFCFRGKYTTGGKERTSERSEEHTSELQSRENLVCRLLLEK